MERPPGQNNRDSVQAATHELNCMDLICLVFGAFSTCVSGASVMYSMWQYRGPPLRHFTRPLRPFSCAQLLVPHITKRRHTTASPVTGTTTTTA